MGRQARGPHFGRCLQEPSRYRAELCDIVHRRGLSNEEERDRALRELPYLEAKAACAERAAREVQRYLRSLMLPTNYLLIDLYCCTKTSPPPAQVYIRNQRTIVATETLQDRLPVLERLRGADRACFEFLFFGKIENAY